MKDLDLNTSPVLPSGSATTGATGSSLGDASMGDLQRGYFNASAPDTDKTLDVALDSDACGVVGRPQGWER